MGGRGAAGSALADAEVLSGSQFSRLASYIQGNYGIRLPAAKKLMIEARLRRRMKKAGFPTFGEYLDHVFSPEGHNGELIHMVDAITTNKTDFFREPSHFDILCRQVLPMLLSKERFTGVSPLRVWSAACSSGEEPYTLAMALSEFAEQSPDFHFQIYASDISTKVLKTAYHGVYREDRVAGMPLRLRQKYLLRSKNRQLELVQVKDRLRRQVAFHRINLMDDDFGLHERMHVIFCRNVMIYFDKEHQEKLIGRFHRQMLPGGFLFIGHSESLSGMKTPFSLIAPTVYKRAD